MIDPGKDWNDTLDALIMALNSVVRDAASALGEAKELRNNDYTDNPMQSEADFFDLTEFMDDLRIAHSRAQKLLDKFCYEEEELE